MDIQMILATIYKCLFNIKGSMIDHSYMREENKLIFHYRGKTFEIEVTEVK